MRILFCEHHKKLQRWHWVHFFDYEPISIEAEYKCSTCGKCAYLHLYGEDAEQYSEQHKDTQVK